jgi:hypothetical protein
MNTCGGFTATKEWEVAVLPQHAESKQNPFLRAPFGSQLSTQQAQPQLLPFNKENMLCKV